MEETLALAGAREAGIAFPCDVRDAEAVERCAGEVRARWGAAGVVVPAAGVGAIAPVEQTTPDALRRLLGVNLVRDYGGILVTAALIVWIGTAVIFTPTSEEGA